MKKRMVWISSGLLAASLIFSGCTNMNTDNPFLTEASESLESSASETSESRTVQESSETASSSQEETSKITQSSMATTSSDLHLDKAWLNAVTDLYHKTHPENDRFSDVYVDEFWAQRENMLNAIDKGMIWYDTSFEDIGINWK